MRLKNYLLHDPNVNLEYIADMIKKQYNIDDYVHNLQWREK